MYRKKLLIPIVFLMFFNFALDRLATKFYWYSGILWFDMLMHFLGGLWVGLFFIYVFLRKNPSSVPFKKVILYVFLIGIAWEVLEIVLNNFIGKAPFDIIDTTSDIFFDLIGGLTAAFYFSKRIMPIKKIGVY